MKTRHPAKSSEHACPDQPITISAVPEGGMVQEKLTCQMRPVTRELIRDRALAAVLRSYLPWSIPPFQSCSVHVDVIDLEPEWLANAGSIEV